jgi:hypothetical protein
MYTYEKFGVTSIPTAKPSHDISTAHARTPVIKTPNGAYTPVLSTQVYDDKAITVGCALWGVTQTAVQAQYKTWRALVGTLDKLYRRSPDNTIEWVWARLTDIQTTRVADNKLWIDANLIFSVDTPIWHTSHHGAPWLLDDGVHFLDTGYLLDENDQYTLDTSPKTITLINNGALPARPLITLTAHTANITALTITAGGVTNLTYSGTIVNGNSLVMDCEAQSIKNNGVNDYAHLTRNGGHTLDGWLELTHNAGTSVIITITGGGVNSVIVFDYWERFL